MAEKLKRVVIKEEFVALTDDPIKAIILNQLMYWTEIIYKADEDTLKEVESFKKIGASEKAGKLMTRLRKGWFWKSAKELQEEIMISTRASVDRKLKELIEAGYIETRKNPNNPMDNTNQYRVNIDFLQEELEKIGYPLEGYPLSKKYHDMVKALSQPTAQNEQSARTAQRPTAQNEQSTARYEQRSAHHEQTIPEITSKRTSERKDNESNIPYEPFPFYNWLED